MCNKSFEGVFVSEYNFEHKIWNGMNRGEGIFARLSVELEKKNCANNSAFLFNVVTKAPSILRREKGA